MKGSKTRIAGYCVLPCDLSVSAWDGAFVRSPPGDPYRST